MAILRIPEKNEEIANFDGVKDYLAGIGVEYEVWKADASLEKGAGQDEVLKAYSSEIESLKSRGGYTTADVIDIDSNTPDLEGMLAKFRKEHFHDEDEVRFTIEGRGVFHINPQNGPVVSVEVSEGDLLRVPKGTHHWFDLCQDRRIRAIRLFQNKSGWTPYYTDSGNDRMFQPVCMGPTYFKPQ